MYYMIGAKTHKVGNCSIFRVLEVAVSEDASLTAMETYSTLYNGIARRIATTQEFIQFSEGKELQFAQLG